MITGPVLGLCDKHARMRRDFGGKARSGDPGADDDNVV